MKRFDTSLPGVVILEPPVYRDARGHFQETWHRERYQNAGVPADFAQDNVSFSYRGVLRGLHFQYPNPQGKLVSVLQGEVYDVAVDIRPGSPRFGQWFGVELSDENSLQLYIPEGFAHGFCVLSDSALFSYKCTRVYDPAGDGAIRWNDPQIGVQWPVSDPVVSDKDAAAPLLADVDPARLPPYRQGD